MSKRVSVGKILNFHGIKGEAKVGFSKGHQDFFCGLKNVLIGDKPFDISQIRLNKNFAIVKFDGIDSIDELMPYKGALLFVQEDEIREAMGEDEFLIDELTGLDVLDEVGKKLGFVVGVSNNGANDMLSVRTASGKVCFVPFVKAIVTAVSVKDKTVTVNNLEGLLE